MPRRSLRLPPFVCALALLAGGRAAAAEELRTLEAGSSRRVLVRQIASDRSSLAVLPIDDSAAAPEWLLVDAPPLRRQLSAFDPGDAADIAVRDNADGEQLLESIVPAVARAAPGARIAGLAGGAAIVWLAALLLVPRRATGLLVGADNRYSNSKFQMAIWFWTLMASYAAALSLRLAIGGANFAGGVDVPPKLLAVSGISALTFAGAKHIAARRLKARTRAASPNFPIDLVTDAAGRPDLGDFQMIVVTLVAAGVYVVRIASWLAVVQLRAHVTLPDVDTTLAGAFGISHAAYLAKKYTGDAL